jgi:hypothetical protein
MRSPIFHDEAYLWLGRTLPEISQEVGALMADALVAALGNRAITDREPSARLSLVAINPILWQ